MGTFGGASVAKKPVTKSAPVKTAPVKTAPAVDLTAFKTNVRTKLKALDINGLARVAKAFSIDTKKYKGMNMGMATMQISNSIVGAAARAVREGGVAQAKVLAACK